MDELWHRFFRAVPLHDSTQGPVKALAGAWPDGLDPDLFAALDWPVLITRLRDYIAMPYPVAMFRTLDDPPGPDYRMVDDQIARASNPALDQVLCSVVPTGFVAGTTVQEVVWNLVARYAERPLPRLLFVLPFMDRGSVAAARGDAPVVTIEGLLIQIYKGVENALFDVYERLPEGGLLGDPLVERRFRDLLLPTGPEPRATDAAAADAPRETTGFLVFDYGAMGLSYGREAFLAIQAALRSSAGVCAFHDGDIHDTGIIRSLLAHAAAVVPATPDGPLARAASEIAFGPYFIGMWTDRPANFRLLHDRLAAAGTVGYLGLLTLPGVQDAPGAGSLFLSLSLPVGPAFTDGRVVPATAKYGLGPD
ncbi:MAG: hypothetical protein KDE22_03465 [Rhodobacterales bacterium]|nr:hypothetical protein [Rhodobacterales bacterium]